MDSEEYVLFDPHVHSSGISKCSHVTGMEIVDTRKSEGYGGIVLTNHCQPWYYTPQEHREFIKRFIAEYRAVKEYADNVGFRAFLGIEVTISLPDVADWLLYGVDEKFLIDSPCLYALTQKELFTLCEKAEVAMVQAHPYRSSTLPRAAEYMHGMEINCTPCDVNTRETVIKEAEKRGIFVTCGTDYHGDARPIKGGIYLPSSVNNAGKMAEYLLNTPFTKLKLGEEIFDVPTGIKV